MLNVKCVLFSPERVFFYNSLDPFHVFFVLKYHPSSYISLYIILFEISSNFVLKFKSDAFITFIVNILRVC